MITKITKNNYKELGFVKAYYCDIPIFLKDLGEEDGVEAVGINWFWDVIFTALLWINFNIRGDEGMYFRVPLTCESNEDCPANTFCLNNNCYKNSDNDNN
jgi:hypothetical protein